VPHYWILDAFEFSIRCMVLREGAYHDDVVGRGNDDVHPSLFPGLVLSLKEIWES
jgi:Uma2 family endonuclease